MLYQHSVNAVPTVFSTIFMTLYFTVDINAKEVVPKKAQTLAEKTQFANLIGKLNFYKLIPYPMDNRPIRPLES